MSEAIKLFGQTISLPSFYQSRHQVFDPSHNNSSSTTSNESCFDETGNCGDDFSDKTAVSLHEFESPSELQGQEIHRELSVKEISDDKQEDSTSNQDTEDSKDPTISKVNEKTKTDRETSPSKETSKNGETSLKKPDKILPCPRCNSMDTKFCYYNNYNVNQPRHFCKNCQRYWTAGGTMRNVPVGAGRRKNKNNAASHYRHIILSEALCSAQLHGVNGVQNPAFGGSSTILSFGSDPPLCESVASVLHLSEKTRKPDQKILVSCGRKSDNGDDSLSGNSVTASNTSETVISPQLQCFPGSSPWQFPWNSAIPSSPAAFCPSGFPVSFYPAQAYWGCTVPNPWNSPCMANNPTSPLGKHSRDGKLINHSQSEDPSTGSNYCSQRRVLAPETLRIEDPTEAVKSSVWTTLGMKPEKSGLELFTGFQMKNEERNFIAEIETSLLQANPAAFSRSLNFRETA